MFKILILIGLGYIMYRLVMPPKQIDQKGNKDDRGADFTDYEEID